jgi:hypothetical protein
LLLLPPSLFLILDLERDRRRSLSRSSFCEPRPDPRLCGLDFWTAAADDAAVVVGVDVFSGYCCDWRRGSIRRFCLLTDRRFRTVVRRGLLDRMLFCSHCFSFFVSRLAFLEGPSPPFSRFLGLSSF